MIREHIVQVYKKFISVFLIVLIIITANIFLKCNEIKIKKDITLKAVIEYLADNNILDNVKNLKYDYSKNGDYWVEVIFDDEALSYQYFYSFEKEAVTSPVIFDRSECIEIARKKIPKYFSDYYELIDNNQHKVPIFEYSYKNDYCEAKAWGKTKIVVYKILYDI